VAKPRSKWNGEVFHRRVDEGRGIGTGLDYRPFIQIHDFPSKGICSRVTSETVGRVHHLFSRNELAFFYILDFDDDVIDIREQYPLLDPEDPHDLCGIVEMMEDVGIKYPRDPKSRYPFVQTSDFVVTTKTGHHVYSIKESKAYDKYRVRELQELERRYWLWRNVPWTIKTEQEINYDLASNICWIYRARDIGGFFTDLTLCHEVMAYEKEQYEHTSFSIGRIANDAESYFHIGDGLGLTSFQRLLFEKKLVIPLDKPLDLMAPRLYREQRGGWYSCLETYQ
jgi:hypothetical protein